MTLMNLSQYLESARSHWQGIVRENGIKTYNCDELVIVSYKSPSVSDAPESLYVFWKKSEITSEGGFGIFRKVYKIDEGGEVDLDTNDFVVKIGTTEDIHPNEAIFLNNNSLMTLPIFKVDSEPVMICKNIKGIDLCDNNLNLMPIIENLPLKNRLQLLAAIALSFNLIHHNTSLSGPAICHNDIKGNNIRISFCVRKENMPDIFLEFEDGIPVPNDSIFKFVDGKLILEDGYHLELDVYPIDFGLARATETEEKQKIPNREGFILNSAPELLKLEEGLKTDIYALTTVMILLLLGKDPYRLKKISMHQCNIHTNAIKNLMNTKFDLKGICSDFPDFLIQEKCVKAKLIDYVTAFINAMQDNDYDKRPNSDQVLRFYQTLYLFYTKYLDLENLRNQSCTNNQNNLDRKIQTNENDLFIYLREMKNLSKQMPEAQQARFKKANAIIQTIEPGEILLPDLATPKSNNKEALIANVDQIISKLQENILNKKSWLFYFEIKMHLKNSDLATQRKAVARTLKQRLENIKKTLDKNDLTPEKLYASEQQILQLLEKAQEANKEIYQMYRRSIDGTGTLDGLIKNSLEKIKNPIKKLKMPL